MTHSAQAQKRSPRLCDDRSLHNEVYAHILAEIHGGELQAGDAISEAKIARDLGISRAPVREAIIRLGNEGLIIRRPRKGAVIREFTPDDLRDIQEVRQLIEGYAAHRACQRLQQCDIEELQELVNSMKAHAEARRWTEATTTNALFHQTVIRIGKNAVLMSLWQTMNPLMWLLAPAVAPRHNHHDPLSLFTRHQELLDVLIEGTPEEASQAFRRHVAEAGEGTLNITERSTGNHSGEE